MALMFLNCNSFISTLLNSFYLNKRNSIANKFGVQELPIILFPEKQKNLSSSLMINFDRLFLLYNFQRRHDEANMEKIMNMFRCKE
jgi:hypothetical protein